LAAAGSVVGAPESEYRTGDLVLGNPFEDAEET